MSGNFNILIMHKSAVILRELCHFLEKHAAFYNFFVVMFTCKQNLKGEHLFPHVRFMYFECMDDLKWKKLDVTFEVSNTRDGP